jgi:beta-mannanase
MYVIPVNKVYDFIECFKISKKNENVSILPQVTHEMNSGSLSASFALQNNMNLNHSFVEVIDLIISMNKSKTTNIEYYYHK